MVEQEKRELELPEEQRSELNIQTSTVNQSRDEEVKGP